MAFTQDTFAPIAQNSTKAPRSWSYQTTDDFATVLSPGYFIDKIFQLSPSDFIWVIASDAQRIIRFDGDNTPEIIAPRPPEEALLSHNFTVQEPTSTDSPIKIKFGDAVVNDSISLDALGTITVLETGYYDATITVDIGRAGASGGVASIFLAAFVNDILFPNPISTRIDTPANVIAQQYRVAAPLDVGDTIHFEIYRDSIGVDQGGLYPETSSIGWGVSPSTRIRILRHV